jgi:DnaJ-class molecular chaperone
MSIPFDTSFLDVANQFLKTQKSVKESDLVYPLKISLVESIHGTTKRRKITRQRKTAQGTYAEESVLLNIVIPPLTEEGRPFRFPNQGDEGKDIETARDIVFMIEIVLPQNVSRQSPYDLVMTHSIPWFSALFGGDEVKVTFPCGQQASLVVPRGSESVIPGGLCRVVVNAGLAIPISLRQKGITRGQLWVHFTTSGLNDLEHRCLPLDLHDALANFSLLAKSKPEIATKSPPGGPALKDAGGHAAIAASATALSPSSTSTDSKSTS